MNAHLMQPTGSAYFLAPETQTVERHTLSVLVDNEPGVLHRVVGLFAARGYNIDSLTVAETDENAHTSRITIVTKGSPAVIEQIIAQLDRLVPVHRVTDLTAAGNRSASSWTITTTVTLGEVIAPDAVRAAGTARERGGTAM